MNKKKEKGEREDGEEMERRRGRGRVGSRMRSMTLSSYFSCLKKEWERRNEEEGNYSKCWFLFFSYLIPDSPLHLSTYPSSLFLFLSLSWFCVPLYHSLSSVLPSLRSYSLTRSITCLFIHPNVCNILFSIYRACGMKCACLCVRAHMCLCMCESALYLYNSLYSYV